MRIDYSQTNVKKNILRDSRAYKMRKKLTKYLKTILCCEYDFVDKHLVFV